MALISVCKAEAPRLGKAADRVRLRQSSYLPRPQLSPARRAMPGMQ